IMDVNLLRDLVKSGSLPEAKLLVVNNGGDKQLAKQIGSQRSNVWTVNATGISMNIFGRVIVNTPMVGALIKVMPIVSLKSVEEAIMERFKGALGERNVEAVRKAYESVEEVKP
ncbi:2-oxoacid:acceptor oxidoreductase family protein, partial [Candidatus Bathyarchaeota archaeon]|nr:2-oxoacid:acceptor oxidoreductase family protein [Candidatus Bathyarchaeota archaeon]